MTGGLLTLRFALAIRPRPDLGWGWRRPSPRSSVPCWCCFAISSGLIDPYVLIGLLGIAAVLTGLLRIAEGAVVTGTGRRAR